LGIDAYPKFDSVTPQICTHIRDTDVLAWKNAHDFRAERLIVRSHVDSDSKAATYESARNGAAQTSTSSGVSSFLDKITAPTELSHAFLPQASLTQVLRLGGTVLDCPPQDIDEVRARYGGIDFGNARRGLEILRRCNLITFDGRRVSAGEELRALGDFLSIGELDSISQILLRFKPYKILVETLHNRKILQRSDFLEKLTTEGDRDVAKEASVRLGRFLVLTGQAWTNDARYLDGSARPNQDAFSEYFDEAFQTVSKNGLARVVELLPELCRRSSMSPWAAKRQIDLAHAAGRLQSYVLQPAAGQKPVAPDSVISGSLLAPLETAVAIDRVDVNGRPIFTIEGPR
jgi:hypothetical protein